MLEMRICRICLIKDVKMYRYDRYQLKSYYEQVMAIKINAKDCLPQWFCCECATMLHKFHKFKEKCYSGQKALNEILWKGHITYESVSQVDRHSKNLQTSLDIINVNKRIKTFLMKHKTAKGKYKKKNIQTADPVKESYMSEDVHKECVADTDPNIDDPILDIKIEKDEAKEMPTEIENNLEYNERVVPLDDKIGNDITNNFLDNDRISSDDDKVLLLIKNDKNNAKINNKKKKTEDKNGISKLKKFERKVKSFVNEANWQKFNLTEEEAVKEFNARSECPTYLKSSYQCTCCIRGFSKLDMFQRHMKLRHSEFGRPFECRFCHIRFRLKCELSRHLRQHYVIYKCMRCELRFYLETSAAFHDDYHNGVIKTCEHCGKEFRHSSTYYTHLRTHRSAHVCALCGEAFVSESGLLRHKRIKHIALAHDESTKEEERIGTYCERCDIKFVTLKAYNEHLSQSALHAESYDGPVDVVPAQPLLKKNKLRKLPRRKPTTCQYCDRHFSTQSACMKHHLAEHPGNPFVPERHICEICGASLALVSLESHLNTHTREKVYSCTICSMQFYSKSSLNRHHLTHTGEKPYKCITCDKRFTQKNSMMLHYRTFHLKQPYPKRNRKKKTDALPIGEAYQNEESEEHTTPEKWR